MNALDHPALAAMASGADHLDEKTFRGPADQRQFLAGIFGYVPAWLRALFAVRGVVATALGLRHDAPPRQPAISPADVPMRPGESLGPWIVRAAEEGRLWAVDITDRHLSAVLAVLSEPAGQGLFLHRVLTIVHYNHWTGPLYFNLIRPFHHLVVWAIGRHAAAQAQ